MSEDFVVPPTVEPVALIQEELPDELVAADPVTPKQRDAVPTGSWLKASALVLGLVLVGGASGGAAMYGIWPKLFPVHEKDDPFYRVPDELRGYGAALPHCASLNETYRFACENPTGSSSPEVLACLNEWGNERAQCIAQRTERRDAVECHAYLPSVWEEERCIASLAQRHNDAYLCISLPSQSLLDCMEKVANRGDSVGGCAQYTSRSEQADCLIAKLETLIEVDDSAIQSFELAAINRLLLNEARECRQSSNLAQERECLDALRAKPRPVLRTTDAKTSGELHLPRWGAVALMCRDLRGETLRDRCVLKLAEHDAAACIAASAGATVACLNQATSIANDRTCEHFQGNAGAYELCLAKLASQTQNAKYCSVLYGYARDLCSLTAVKRKEQCDILDPDLIPRCRQRIKDLP